MELFTVLIEDLTLEVIIGMLEQERKKSQKVIVNAKIQYDKDKFFLDYTQAVEAIENLLKYKNYTTVEDALEDICKALKIDFPEIVSITLRIYKPEIYKNALVGVEIKKRYE